MGYWFHYVYIDDQECPTLAKQKAKEEAILAEIRQAQAERESARPERTEATRKRWIAKPPRKKPTEPIKGEWVYFVLDPSMGLIKIGFTSQLEIRLERLKSDYSKDLRFLGAFKGSRKDEATMHKMFRVFKCDMKRYTEWFFDMDPIYWFIDRFTEVKQFDIDFLGERAYNGR